MRRQGDEVVVNVQLIDARNDRHIWANTLIRELTDIQAESELATEIAEQLRATLTAHRKSTSWPPSDANSRMPTSFTCKREPDLTQPRHLARGLQRSGRAALQQVITLDPNFRPGARAARVDCGASLSLIMSQPTLGNEGPREAEAALRLQPDLAEGTSALGQCIYWMDQDYDEGSGTI